MAEFKLTATRSKFGMKRWRWNLVADNNEVVATSEQYNSVAAALNGIRVVQALAATASVTEVDLL